MITSDGTTILGADDKAGIAEILTMVERLVSKQIPHGPISIAFTPDEEMEVELSILISSGLMLILLILWMAIPRMRSSLKF